MKKLCSLLVLVAMIVTMSTPVFAQEVTLTLLIDNTTPTSGIEAAAAKIKEELGIGLEIEIRPGGAEGENLVRTRLAAGEMADLCYFNSGSLLSTLNPAVNFVDMTDKPYMSTFSDSYKVTVTVDGKIYGVPSGSSFCGAWMYNKAAYKELGLEVPHTWEQLMANCEVIKNAGKTAVIASFADDWSSQLILLSDYYNIQQGSPNFAADFDANKAKYATDPAAFKAFEKMAEVFNKGYLNADYNANTYDYALQMLVNGDGVHYPMLTNALTNIDKNYGREAVDNIGVFGQPGDNADDHGLTVWLPNSIYVYKNSPNVEKALAWIEYFVSPEGIAAYASASSAEGPYVVTGVEMPKDAYAGVLEMMPYFDAGKTAPALEFITSVKGPNSPQICIECMGGLRSAQECAAEYDADVEKQAKQLGLAGW
ncbi:MAG: ABC transporter substrate-binding protein [Clostridia bacterium]